MNPKHAPALSTVPDKKVKSAEKVEVIRSIKQQEQIDLYNALKKVNQKF